jgi:pimeloyl-ACP methyl ester carboxylesterase
MIGWAAAAFHPKLVSRLVVLGAAHPLRLRAAIFADPRGQLAASSTVLRFRRSSSSAASSSASSPAVMPVARTFRSSMARSSRRLNAPFSPFTANHRLRLRKSWICVQVFRKWDIGGMALANTASVHA